MMESFGNNKNYPWNQQPDFKSLDRARLKQEFLQPFDEEKVCEGFKNPQMIQTEEDHPNIEMYRRYIDDFTYRIAGYADEGKIPVDIFFQLSRDVSKKPEAELVFRSMNSPGAGRGFNLAHRIIKTQEEGISGSAFLKQAEAYLAILKKNQLIDAEWIGLESIQPNVTEFFIKNGYTFFVPPNDAYELYKKQPELFETVLVDFGDNLEGRDPVPVHKDAFNDPDFMKYCINDTGIKKVVIDFHNFLGSHFDKYIPKAILGKQL